MISEKRVEAITDKLLLRATTAIRSKLLADVTSLFRELVKTNYESPKEIELAPEWQQLEILFSSSCDRYVSIATSDGTAENIFHWVEKMLELDQDAIFLQHFLCDRLGSLDRTPTLETAGDREVWRAMAHNSLFNVNSQFWAFNKCVRRAASAALENLAIRMASPRQRDHSADHHSRASNSALLQIPLRGTGVAAPLSSFESTVGGLMVEARSCCSTKCLPRAEVAKIAAFLDAKGVALRSNLERQAAQTIAKHNQTHPTIAIKTWEAALKHPAFRRCVRKRFSRAEEKYKKALPRQ
jgi:hypothetical protein